MALVGTLWGTKADNCFKQTMHPKWSTTLSYAKVLVFVQFLCWLKFFTCL